MQIPPSKYQKRLTHDSKPYTGSSSQHPSNHHLSDHPVKRWRLAQMRQLLPKKTLFGAGHLIR
jgi:hypothetical protein